MKVPCDATYRYRFGACFFRILNILSLYYETKEKRQTRTYFLLVHTFKVYVKYLCKKRNMGKTLLFLSMFEILSHETNKFLNEIYSKRLLGKSVIINFVKTNYDQPRNSQLFTQFSVNFFRLPAYFNWWTFSGCWLMITIMLQQRRFLCANRIVPKHIFKPCQERSKYFNIATNNTNPFLIDLFVIWSGNKSKYLE